MVGRDTPGIKHSNDEIHAMVKGHKELVGVGSIDPHRWGVKAAVAEVERAVNELGLKAINVEPGFGSPRAMPTIRCCSRSTRPARNWACR